MRAAMVMNTVCLSVDENLRQMTEAIKQAARAEAELVLFPEAAVTGFIHLDEPEHDLPIGQTIPGAATDILCATARQAGVYVGTGLLEREADTLFDTALLIDPHGEVVLTYRRMQPQWHKREADPTVYRQGIGCAAIATPFGRMTFLLCGDLFDDHIVARVRELRPDYLLFPFARCFGDGSFDQERWNREEEADYVARAARSGATALMVNELQDPRLTSYPSFGGAMVVSPAGEILAKHPLGQEGILYFNG